VFKLEHLLSKLPRLNRGAHVVELGCWPGGWLQILAERVGPTGRVVGVDLEPLEPLPEPVQTLQLDFTEPDAPARIEAALGRPADAVISDAAPKLTGIRDLDRAALEELHEAALRVVDRVLRPGGAILLKGFPGAEGDRFRALLRGRFERVSEVRPEGRRSTSKEFYWVIPGDLGAPSEPRGGRRRERSRRGSRA
jgi:23S rRNA (uridine2552-2'-O)-methyltransferase